MKKDNFVLGSLYSIQSHTGKFKVAKILVIDDKGFHIRLYKNTFNIRPEKVDSNALILGKLNDKNDFGIGHLPITKEIFVKSKPFLLEKHAVTEEELTGYKIWLESHSGYFTINL